VIPQRGIYTVGNRQFFDKLPALQHASKTKEQVTWSYGDDIFSTVNWTVEPSETIEELYIERCQQLRDDYDYLVLFYSGGADSHNILTHFIKAGIHIDEIVSYHAVSYYEKRKKRSFDTNQSQLHNEWYNTVLPDFKNLANIIPNTKLTVFDYTDQSVNLDLTEDWLDIVGEYIHPGAANRIHRYTFDTALTATIQRKRVGLIYGIDKPRVFKVNDQWYMSFLDSIASQPPRLPKSLVESGASVEHFYWSDKSVRMLVKQGHLIKQFYETSQVNIEPPSNTCVPVEMRTRYDNITRSLVYPFWRDQIFQIDKPTSMWWNATDTWTLNESARSKDIWLGEYFNILTTVDPKFIQRDSNGNAESFGGFWSKWHQL